MVSKALNVVGEVCRQPNGSVSHDVLYIASYVGSFLRHNDVPYIYINIQGGQCLRTTCITTNGTRSARNVRHRYIMFDSSEQCTPTMLGHFVALLRKVCVEHVDFERVINVCE